MGSNIIEKLIDNFEHGSFILVVAMDKVNEDIENMISFINTSKFRVFGYELESYRLNDDQNVIVPRIVGSESDAEQASPSGSSRHSWDENSFTEYLTRQNEPIRTSVGCLFDYTRKRFGKFKFGNSSVPDFRITSKMLGVKSYGAGKNPDNVLFMIRANGEIYSRTDYFIHSDGSYSCVAVQHFYEEMKKLLGATYNEFLKGNYIGYNSWGSKTERIREIIDNIKTEKI